MERGAYKISEEIVVDRAITIQGDALMLPMIDCKQSVRGFRVKVCMSPAIAASRQSCLTYLRAPARRPRKANSSNEVPVSHIPEQAGGHLTLRFVRINQGKGEIRPRRPADTTTTTDGEQDGARSSEPVSIEIRGGTVLFEPSAEGGTFVGVYFMGGEGTIAEVQDAIALSFGAASIRTYGGRVSDPSDWDVGDAVRHRMVVHELF